MAACPPTVVLPIPYYHMGQGGAKAALQEKQLGIVRMTIPPRMSSMVCGQSRVGARKPSDLLLEPRHLKSRLLFTPALQLS